MVSPTVSLVASILVLVSACLSKDAILAPSLPTWADEIMCKAVSSVLVQRLLLHPLSQFPGPKLWAVTRVPYMLAFRDGSLAHKIRRFHEKYGEVIRVAPNELSFIRPDAIREIYAKRPNDVLKTLPKDPVRQPPPQPGAPVTILEANDLDHARIRRGWSASFSSSSLAAQEPLINGYVDKLVQKLTAMSKEGKVLDLQQWYSFCTFDIITSLSFGEDLQCTEHGRYHEWVGLLVFSIKARVQMAACRFYPVLYDMLMRFMSDKAKQMLAKHMAFTKDKVVKRLNTQTDHPDFFSHMHRADMTEAEIILNAATMIFAGSHTLQTALTGITLRLLDDRAVLRRVTDEVRGRFSSEKDISFRALLSLPYFNAVVQEGMRLTAPVPLGLTRMIPEGGSVICGFPLPAGTMVSYQMWAANTSDKNFTQPHEFHPERFLKTADSATFSTDRTEAMQPFLVGPRDCIGQNLARVEIFVILARMLYAFDMSAPQGTFEWESQETYAVWTRSPLMAKLTTYA